MQEKDVAIAAGSQEKNNDQIETVTEARLSYESVFLDKLETAKSTDLHIFDTSGKGGTVTYQVDDGKTETKTGASEDLLDGRIRLTEDMLPVLLPEGVGYTGRGGVFVDIMHPDGNMDSYYANGDGKIMFSIDRDGHASIGGGGYDTVADALLQYTEKQARKSIRPSMIRCSNRQCKNVKLRRNWSWFYT